MADAGRPRQPRGAPPAALAAGGAGPAPLPRCIAPSRASGDGAGRMVGGRFGSAARPRRSKDGMSVRIRWRGAPTGARDPRLIRLRAGPPVGSTRVMLRVMGFKATAVAAGAGLADRPASAAAATACAGGAIEPVFAALENTLPPVERPGMVAETRHARAPRIAGPCTCKRRRASCPPARSRCRAAETAHCAARPASIRQARAVSCAVPGVVSCRMQSKTPASGSRAQPIRS